MRRQLLDVLHAGDRHIRREGQRWPLLLLLLCLTRAGWQRLLLLRERRLLLWSLGLHANLLRLLLLHGEAACLLRWELVLGRHWLLERLLMLLLLLLLLVREGRRPHSGRLSLPLPLLLCIEWLLVRRTSCRWWWCSSCMIRMCLEWLLLLL
jgi:hypothetical protein